MPDPRLILSNVMSDSATPLDAAGHAPGLAELLAAEPAFDPREAASGLDLPPAQETPPAWPTFWAVNPQLSPLELLDRLAATDHAHAAAARSYWWFSGPAGDQAGVLACQGWPGPAELGWLIAGGQTEGDDE